MDAHHRLEGRERYWILQASLEPLHPTLPIGRHPHPILISHVSGSMARYGFRILDPMQPCQLAWRHSKLGLGFRCWVFVAGYREARRSHRRRVSGGGDPLQWSRSPTYA
jgi:hypothetical protein